MKSLLLILISTVLAFVLTLPASACTTFQLRSEGQVLVGKNYDWMVEDGLIIVNKRGVAKTAMKSSVDNSGLGTPAKWISKYGSITFTQYGRELGPGGMNEAGLVVESMGLFRNTPNKKYPEPDSRVSILVQQWRQYQLDNFASVKEVVESDGYLRIRPKKGPHSHFIISDKTGNCALIEFLDGEMVCYRNESLPLRVLTNNTYDLSLGFLKQKNLPEPDPYRSIERFNRAAGLVGSYQPGVSDSPVSYAFGILEAVSWSIDREWQGTPYTSNTRWSIVYDQHNLKIYFRTHGNPEIRSVDMQAFDFACATPVQTLDITAKLSGDVTNNFIPYTQKSNRELIEKAFTQTLFLPKFTTEQLDTLSKYPDTLTCGN
jgi:choloylglycine hydrolase